MNYEVYTNRQMMGIDAAAKAASCIRNLLKQQDLVNIIFAAAPSQNEFLAALIQETGIDWKRVNAFHMDEYVGLPAGAPQSFGRFLKERLFSKCAFRQVHYIDGNAANTQQECERYAALLTEFPPHIVCMGIGENNHIAFNDPHVADFNDPLPVKKVTLDDACRQQQVNDGCFASLQQVPEYAITLTIPALLQAPNIFCMVPGHTKAKAVQHTLHSELSELYPSTILRTHAQALLFLDKDSAQFIH